MYSEEISSPYTSFLDDKMSIDFLLDEHGEKISLFRFDK